MSKFVAFTTLDIGISWWNWERGTGNNTSREKVRSDFPNHFKTSSKKIHHRVKTYRKRRLQFCSLVFQMRLGV